MRASSLNAALMLVSILVLTTTTAAIKCYLCDSLDGRMPCEKPLTITCPNVAACYWTYVKVVDTLFAGKFRTLIF